MQTYTQRAELALSPIGKRLLTLMDEKKSNLAVALDVTSQKQCLEMADALGPEIVLLKTHVDILEDYTPSFPQALRALADKHQFLIFEDRKFADIGNTVKWQYQGGLYRIADWADITNAHIVPGPGIIEGLKQVGLERGRGLLLLAQMSTKGSLANGHYTTTAVEWAREHSDFVIGFIATRQLTKDPAFIHLTPGVQIEGEKDTLGQQYLTPTKVIGELFSDVLIVGRGIYHHPHPVEEARRYRSQGWAAYERRLTHT